MTLACAAEMVAPIANMLEAALALRSLVNDSVTTTTVPPVCGGADDRADQGEGPHAERRIEDHHITPKQAGDHLCTPVDPGPGAGQHRVDRPPIRARRR